MKFRAKETIASYHQRHFSESTNSILKSIRLKYSGGMSKLRQIFQEDLNFISGF